ncbi:helix-turn-helix domain-containing protein [Xanthomonas campestris pv. raphani]|uniref:helix-turn-helix transcriptional regulator n=1 Tax=Xanthomonas campestris TaxID=339 RepID=UPI002B223CEF|nr:helix-turn-helix domain-containing protein [Xanthomonas campestris]MEA9796209.1 helix-turn-helix domain-containing protein [Xanthomonas campestris pv. raphani]
MNTEIHTNVITSRLKCPAAAAYLGLSSSALDKMRHEGRGPRYLKIGGRVFYRQADLDAYLDASVVETTESRARAG